MVRIFIIALLSLVAFHASALTKVTATIDKNPVTVKESIILSVVADDDVDSNALNTAPLQRDFIVGRTSVSTQTSMINFQTSRTTRWQTVLIPRKEGTIVVPSLEVDGHQTAPITLTVLAADDPNANTQRDVFITAEVSNTEVYVQQMLTMTVKLHFAAELKRGSLTEPVMDGATITQVGQDKESETIINGRRYRIIERTFTVTPQQSGELVLSSPMFSGEIMVQSARRSNFLSFGETKAISVLGEELPIKVKAKPANFQSHWLPSELLSLHQEWTPNSDTFKVGEPITRTITLTAIGVSKEQLPELELSLPTGLKLYPDQQTAHSNVTNGRFVSQTVSNFAIVASKAGEYLLPAVEVPWWNTVTNRLELAILPAQSITVLPGDNADQRTFIPPSNTQNVESSPTTMQPTPSIVIEKNAWLQWLFLALWLLTTFAWIITEILRRKATAPITLSNDDTSSHQLGLMAACKKNNGQQALHKLVPWYNNFAKTNCKTITDIKHHSQSAELIEAIDELQQHYYSKNADQSWHGRQLLTAISQLTKQQATNKTNNSFSLNPR